MAAPKASRAKSAGKKAPPAPARPRFEVVASLQAEATLARATDLTVQVHSIDPPHPYILRSIELVAERVAPALGWVKAEIDGERRVA